MLSKFYIEKLKSNFSEALRVILTNKIRTLLTALGIIFGVAAVITMLAIGNGAEKEILSQLELVGVNNIVITPLTDKKSTNESVDEETEEKEVENTGISKGLDIDDAKSIQKNIPSVKTLSPEIVLKTNVIKNGRQIPIKLIGIFPEFFGISNMDFQKGKNFTQPQIENSLPVCIIGKKIEKKLFTGESALGKYIKVKDVWLKIVGVTKEKFISKKAQENLGIRDSNFDIYIPFNTYLVRFKGKNIKTDNNSTSQSNNPNNTSKKNYHQLDKLIVQVNDSKTLNATVDIIGRLLKRKHNNVVDFEISVPIQLLKQQQKTKQIFNIVLSIIAGISLLIGGIGIMNIMLASVLERTKEIGIIRAIGATQEDVILQFLTESVLVSIGGGIVGILLGITAAYILEITTGIETILTVSSILISFFVATLIGLIFGIAPAKSAAKKRPIEAIRHE